MAKGNGASDEPKPRTPGSLCSAPQGAQVSLKRNTFNAPQANDFCHPSVFSFVGEGTHVVRVGNSHRRWAKEEEEKEEEEDDDDAEESFNHGRKELA